MFFPSACTILRRGAERSASTVIEAAVNTRGFSCMRFSFRLDGKQERRGKWKAPLRLARLGCEAKRKLVAIILRDSSTGPKKRRTRVERRRWNRETIAAMHRGKNFSLSPYLPERERTRLTAPRHRIQSPFPAFFSSFLYFFFPSCLVGEEERAPRVYTRIRRWQRCSRRG